MRRGTMRPLYHVITPGDHYSPRTGSAIPTVVHGLATGAARAEGPQLWSQHVVVQRGTFTPRYPSAVALECEPAPFPTRSARYRDAAASKLGLPRRSGLAWFAPAAEALADSPPGVVLAHNAPLLPWLLRDTDHQVVLYAHNHLLRGFTRFEAARLLAPAAGIVCVSESLAAQTRRRLPPALTARVRVVLNGAAPWTMAPAAERDPGPVRVMFLGRVIPPKGPDLLLAAARLLGRSDVEYSIVGSAGFDRAAPPTRYERSLRRMAERVAAPVEFEPFVDRARVPETLSRADVLVVPSRWPDPAPLTVLEGMVSGRPVVAARRGGIPEILGDAGELFDPDRPSELAEILSRLIDDEERRGQLGRQGRARAEARDWTWSWGRLEAALDSL